MAYLYADSLGQLAQECVSLEVRTKANFDRADLASQWVALDTPAEGVGEELVAVADPEHGSLLRNRFGKPARTAFTPILPLRHQCARTRDHDPGEGVGIGKRISFVDIGQG